MSVGEEAEADILPRSSADFDQGLREMLRKSPSPPREEPGGGGEDGIRFAWGRESGTADVVRARERSTTDLHCSVRVSMFVCGEMGRRRL